MTIEDTEFIIDYLHDATPEDLELLDAAPSRLSSRQGWKEFCRTNPERSHQLRENLYILWLQKDQVGGFSNVPSNRAEQSAGFIYLKKHKTVPNRLNDRQSVTRWVFQREDP